MTRERTPQKSQASLVESARSSHLISMFATSWPGNAYPGFLCADLKAASKGDEMLAEAPPAVLHQAPARPLSARAQLHLWRRVCYHAAPRSSWGAMNAITWSSETFGKTLFSVLLALDSTKCFAKTVVVPLKAPHACRGAALRS